MKALMLFCLLPFALFSAEEKSETGHSKSAMEIALLRFMAPKMSVGSRRLQAQTIVRSFHNEEVQFGGENLQTMVREFKEITSKSSSQALPPDWGILILAIQESERPRVSQYWPPDSGRYQSIWVGLFGALIVDRIYMRFVRPRLPGILRGRSRLSCQEELVQLSRPQRFSRFLGRQVLWASALSMSTYSMYLEKNDSWYSSERALQKEILPHLISLQERSHGSP